MADSLKESFAQYQEQVAKFARLGENSNTKMHYERYMLMANSCIGTTMDNLYKLLFLMTVKENPEYFGDSSFKGFMKIERDDDNDDNAKNWHNVTMV
jgi:hypothetical protein